MNQKYCFKLIQMYWL